MSSLALLIFIYPTHVQATEECGSIFAPPLPWLESGSVVYEESSIAECARPFGETLSWRDDMDVKVDGVSLSPGVSFVVSDNGTSEYEVRPSPTFGSSDVGWFLHTERGYEFQKTSPSHPEQADIERLAGLFFASEVDVQPYIMAVLAGEVYINDETDPLLFDFYEYIEREFVPVLPTLPLGTYTVVVTHTYVTPVKARPRLLDWLIPTAYAALPEADEVYTMTFSLVAETVEEKPSILFLPGIMGSRLFEESTECGLGAEQERWFAFLDCNHERLSMDGDGVSEYPLYTKPGEAGVFDAVPVFIPIYKEFIETLKDWQETEQIADYALVPYDWRLRLADVLKTRYDAVSGRVIYDADTTLTESYLYTSLADLVAAGGKVTIVAHSNGGLLAKYFIHALEEANDPLLAEIDNLILVGVPQLGTPDAVDGILHGSKIPLVMGAPLSRELVNTMPFIYHLLPGTGYFNSVQTPAIVITPGSVTDAWVAQFGPAIYSREDLHTFMVQDSGRTVPVFGDLETPAVVDSAFLEYARAAEVFQTSFAAPPGMKVYQVAGTGVSTPSGVEYFADQKCVLNVHGVCLDYEAKLGHRVHFVIDGDDTVVTASALAMSESSEVERWWLDLEEYNSNTRGFGKNHKDIFEVDEVSSFIGNVVTGSQDVSYQYLDENSPEFDNKSRLILQLHSPLDLMVRLRDGELVSSSSPFIRNVVYQRFGEVQTLSIPEDETNFTILLVGTGTGSFTLDLERYRGNDREARETYSAIPSSTSTVVQLALPAVATAYYELVVDYDGDGVVDTMLTRGEVEAEGVSMISQSKTGSRPARLIRPSHAGLLGEEVIAESEVDPRQLQIVTLAAEVVRLLTLLVEYNIKKHNYES